jgi:predicted acetyltransferase
MSLEGGMPMAVLWPFRPDFYRKIGFGYGGKKYRYSLLPSTLPHAAGKSHVTHAGDADYEAMAGCYTRMFANRHGMLDETGPTIKSTVGPANGGKAAVYRDGDEVRGFMIYRFVKAHPTNFVSNDLHVEECLYEHPEVLAEFMSFLHSQHDQVRRIIFDTPDAEFYYAPVDPRNDSNMMYPSVYHESHTAAVGAMYMVLDIPNLIESTPGAVYGDGAITVDFVVDDPWWGKAGGSTRIAFANGRAEIAKAGRADIEVALHIADFSSLIMGAVRLSRLVEYGLA